MKPATDEMWNLTAVARRRVIIMVPALPGGPHAVELLTRASRLTSHDRSSRIRQGYLLVAIGENPA